MIYDFSLFHCWNFIILCAFAIKLIHPKLTNMNNSLKPIWRVTVRAKALARTTIVRSWSLRVYVNPTVRNIITSACNKLRGIHWHYSRGYHDAYSLLPTSWIKRQHSCRHYTHLRQSARHSTVRSKIGNERR